MEISHSPYLKHLYVCINKRETGAACSTHGAGEAIREKLKAYVKANGLKGKVRVSSSGCMDLCAQGPNVMVEPDHRWYHHVMLEDVDRIIQEQMAPLKSESASAPAGPRDDRALAPIQAFLFDLGNVLVRFDHMVLARKMAGFTRLGAEELCQTFYDSPLVVEHDAGRISLKDFHQALEREIGLRMSLAEFESVWNGIFSGIDPMVALVRRLVSGYPCFLISNTNRSHFEFCLKNYPVLRELHGWILSYEVGALKPHPAIYRRALDLARVPPERIFYIDDRQDLIEAASRLGFQTHRFTNETAPLLAELSARGIRHGEF